MIRPGPGSGGSGGTHHAAAGVAGVLEVAVQQLGGAVLEGLGQRAQQHGELRRVQLKQRDQNHLGRLRTEPEPLTDPRSWNQQNQTCRGTSVRTRTWHRPLIRAGELGQQNPATTGDVQQNLEKFWCRLGSGTSPVLPGSARTLADQCTEI